MDGTNGLAERMAQRAEGAVAIMMAEPGESGPPSHPAAAMFPMLSDDALADLAVDIRTNGLRYPIVIDPSGVVIAGRNRLAACKLAGVQPTFQRFDGDPIAYIISENINRRDLRAGQKAMVLADVLATFAEQQEYGRLGGVARAGGVRPEALARARTVREFEDLAAQVRAGADLQAAHKEAVERKRRQAAAQEDAEKHLAYVEDQQRKAVERLEAARAGIGPPVTVPAEPDLAVSFSHLPTGEVKLPDDARGLGDNLDREAALLRRLGSIKAELVTLAAEDVIEDAWFFEGHVLAVRSWASQIVATVYDMVEAHNAALKDDGVLRRVK